MMESVARRASAPASTTPGRAVSLLRRSGNLLAREAQQTGRGLRALAAGHPVPAASRIVLRAGVASVR
jgi:hypothetical protein